MLARGTGARSVRGADDGEKSSVAQHLLQCYTASISTWSPTRLLGFRASGDYLMIHFALVRIDDIIIAIDCQLSEIHIIPATIKSHHTTRAAPEDYSTKGARIQG